MSAIKQAYIQGSMDAMQAAVALSRHNGNPLAGNLQIVARWAR